MVNVAAPLEPELLLLVVQSFDSFFLIFRIYLLTIYGNTFQSNQSRPQLSSFRVKGTGSALSDGSEPV